MKEKIYDIIEVGKENKKANKFYAWFMMVCIILSLVPLAFKGENEFLKAIDDVTVTVFIIDYLLRLLTADCKYNQGALSYVRYPFSPMAIVDLLSILPSLTLMYKAFKVLRIARMGKLSRFLRVSRTIKAARTIRYSKSANTMLSAIKKSKDALIQVCDLAIAYIIISALIIFNVEPQTFNTFFDAVYWATTSLTTVGYGDLYAVSVAGKAISMISSFVGIGIIALPSGIITANFVNEINAEKDEIEKEE